MINLILSGVVTILAAHILFITPPLISKILKRGFKPGKLDIVSKHISHILIVPVAFLGIFGKSPLLTLLLWIPPILIIVANLLKRLLKKAPFLLITLNIIIYFFSGALIVIKLL